MSSTNAGVKGNTTTSPKDSVEAFARLSAALDDPFCNRPNILADVGLSETSLAGLRESWAARFLGDGGEDLGAVFAAAYSTAQRRARGRGDPEEEAIPDTDRAPRPPSLLPPPQVGPASEPPPAEVPSFMRQSTAVPPLVPVAPPMVCPVPVPVAAPPAVPRPSPVPVAAPPVESRGRTWVLAPFTARPATPFVPGAPVLPDRDASPRLAPGQRGGTVELPSDLEARAVARAPVGAGRAAGVELPVPPCSPHGTIAWDPECVDQLLEERRRTGGGPRRG